MTRRERKPDIPRLAETEWEVMKPFWDQGPLAARDVYAAIPESRGWAYKTVKTMLSRLVKKGALTYDQVGNSYLYRPVYTREEMTREEAQSFVQRVFDGALNPFLAYFVESASPEELKRIRKELDEMARKKAGENEP